MQKPFLIACFCCLTLSKGFSQNVAIYIKAISTSIKSYSHADLYYVQNDSVHQCQIIVPTSDFYGVYFLDPNKPVTSLAFDFKDDIVKPYKGSSYFSLHLYKGDSVIVDMDKKTVSIINKK